MSSDSNTQHKPGLTVTHNTPLMFAYISGSFVLVVVTAYYYYNVGPTATMVEKILPWVTGLGVVITTLASMYTGAIRAMGNHLTETVVHPITASIDKVGKSLDTNAYTQYCLSEDAVEKGNIEKCVLQFSVAKKEVGKSVAEMREV